ncbi:lipoprotein [Streptomyces zinciresistens K42]|uniref:Lipoprotein n=1 Tax=Streptomyces zinciresistens K42 TaxID=700597 RepID=G2GK52_9ACTN|nr:lipoprotein [Streptomyces zinciresistens K42]
MLVSALCALAVSGTALTGCSKDPNEGTNGVGKLPPAQILSKTRKAAGTADAVRLSGTVVTSGRTYKLDMRLKAAGATGSVTAKDATFQLLRVGEQLYLKADAGFWSAAGHDGKADAAAVDKLDGKYVKVPAGDPAYKKFSGFTDKRLLLDGLVTVHGTPATDGYKEQAGVRTIRITGDKGAGGTLDVSLKGTPYPLRLTRAGGAGTLTFAAWGKDFALEEPAEGDTVDYGRQLPTS